MARVLIVSSDVVGERMAGPGIRAWELSRALAAEHQVTLAAPGPARPTPADFAVIAATRSALDRAAASTDVAVVQGAAFELSRSLRSQVPALVIDLYDPYPVEGLEFNRELSLAERQENLDRDLQRLREQCLAGDFFLCASERQRLFWLGVLAGFGRVDIAGYDADPTLRRLVEVVPFGVPPTPPERGAARLRGVVPGIAAGDFLVIWGGGIWNWLDPLTLIRAVAEVAPSLPQVKVIFPGSGHPNPAVPRMQMAAAAKELAAELDLLDRHVFFLGEWVPYAQRGALLAECDAGVSLHRPGIEADLAFRTRVLDYLWAGLPVVLTEGDAIADLVAGAGAGLTVAAEDGQGLAEALRRLVTDADLRDRCRAGSHELARQLSWERVAAPLNEFCRSPRRTRPAGAGVSIAAPSRSALLRRAWRSVRRDGPAAAATRGYRYLRARR